MATQERTETPLGTNYAKHQQKIDKGQRMELAGWWDAATECRKKWNGNAQAYGIAAEKDSKVHSRKNGIPYHSWNTIRQYVGAMMKAQEAGFTVDQFHSINDVREEMKSATKSTKKPKTRREELRDFLSSLSAAELQFVESEAKALRRAKGK